MSTLKSSSDFGARCPIRLRAIRPGQTTQASKADLTDLRFSPIHVLPAYKYVNLQQCFRAKSQSLLAIAENFFVGTVD